LVRSAHNVINGVVLTFINISQIEEAYAAMSEARAFATAVVDTVRESLLVLDKDMRVVFAGQSFCDTFGVLRKETEGSLLSELGTGEWDIPRLRDLLGRVLSEDRDFVGFEVEHVFPAIGRKTMVLNAKRLKPEAGREVMILLAIEDIADREAARG
jgi:two-component system CheB/CheR fusion protein